MRSLVRLLVWTLLICGAIVGLLRATSLRWWRVPEDDPWLVASVSPTLAPGDWVLLWRLTRPQEGDLVICPEPKAPERVVVGRVLATGNDVIDVSGTTVNLNSKSLRRESGCDGFSVPHPKTGQLVEQTCSVEDLDGSLYTRGNLIEGFKPPPAMQPFTVTPGQFFLVSDNRQFSLDSRDFGPVDASSCKETFVFRLWGRNGYFDPTRRFELIP
jgi:signal peptidase I